MANHLKNSKTRTGNPRKRKMQVIPAFFPLLHRKRRGLYGLLIKREAKILGFQSRFSRYPYQIS